MPEKNIKERTTEILKSVKLTEASKRKIGQYSGGMKQRLGIAVTLFINPEIITIFLSIHILRRKQLQGDLR